MYGQLWLPFPWTASSFILLLKHSDHKLTGDKQILIGPVKKCQLKRWPFFTVTPISGNTSWNLQWSCTIHLSWYCRLNCFYCSPLWNNIQNIHELCYPTCFMYLQTYFDALQLVTWFILSKIITGPHWKNLGEELLGSVLTFKGLKMPHWQIFSQKGFSVRNHFTNVQ